MKKSFILLGLLLYFLAPMFSNPFYSSPVPVNPMENNMENIEEETLPVPVLSSPVNKEIKEIQMTLREKIAFLLQRFKNSDDKNVMILSLFLFAFLYGIIHASGPGHRKTVVFSIYMTRKSSWYEPLITGLVLAVLHGGCSVVLILIYKGAAGALSANINKSAIYLEGFTYAILILMALFMIAKESIEFIQYKRKSKSDINIKKQEENKHTQKENSIKLIPFLLSGIYPCPGAILILVLSFTLNILEVGIFCVISMSFGMAIVIIAVAYAAWFGRKKLMQVAENHKMKIQNISFAIELSGYLILLFFSLHVSLPFFLSL